MKPPVPSEHAEQVSIIQEARIRGRTDDRWNSLYANPNGGKRGIGTAVKLKAEGVQRGIPDLHLPEPCGGFHGLWIELKKRRGSVASPEQVAWIIRLRRLGHQAEICYGAESAIQTIKDYLAKGST